MDPIAGNHEYKTGNDAFGSPCPTSNSTAQPYFDHFGAAAHPDTNGHFSFDLGSWHLIGLNANCSKSGVGGCTATSAQTNWLKGDLASTSQPCILAFWHQPRFTGNTGPVAAYTPWWQALYDAHADVVLNGHVHNYQRYSALDPTGAGDAITGITEYVVGTGGENLQSVKSTVQPAPVVSYKTFGYLQMTLLPDGWTADFVNSAGTVLDTSAGSCHL